MHTERNRHTSQTYAHVANILPNYPSMRSTKDNKMTMQKHNKTLHENTKSVICGDLFLPDCLNIGAKAESEMKPRDVAKPKDRINGPHRQRRESQTRCAHRYRTQAIEVPQEDTKHCEDNSKKSQACSGVNKERTRPRKHSPGGARGRWWASKECFHQNGHQTHTYYRDEVIVSRSTVRRI